MTIASGLRVGCGLCALAFVVVSCDGGLNGSDMTGTAGTTGTAGVTGAAGTSGDAGTTGAAGTSDTAGVTGSAGTIGSAGTTGSAGVTGIAGVTGSGGTVGSGGIIGGGGITGGGGVTGVGGMPNVCIPRTPLNCGASLCGNGAIDTCNVPSGTGPCPTISFTEACDGTHFGTDTCAAHAYGSGMLKCTSDCNVDVSKCVDCATGAKIASCGNAPFTAQPLALGMAGTSTELGIAWMASPALNGPLTFARLSPTLKLLSTTTIQDAALMQPSNFYGDVRVAPLPSGWVVAAYGNGALFLHTLDATGKDLGRTTIDSPASVSITVTALFAPRADGGPLVIWETGSELRSAVVAADGRSVTSPRALPFYGSITEVTAAYVGGAFYVAGVAGSVSATLRMVRIETDGAVGTSVDVLPGAGARKPTLVAGADDLRLVYRSPVGSASTDTAIFSQKITATGASASDPVALAAGADRDHAAGAFAFGADTVAVLTSLSERWLGGVRVDGAGQVATPLYTIMSVPDGLAGHSLEQRVARVGSDVVGLWYTSGGIRLARVTP